MDDYESEYRRRRRLRRLDEDPEDLYERGKATIRWGGAEGPQYVYSGGAAPVRTRRRDDY